MPKSSSKALFRLVKNMNGNEKRYFQQLKQQENGAGKDQYMVLYKELNKLKKDYDEDHLKTIVEAQQFSYIKNYLYKQLLDSLFSYHSDNTPDLIVLKQLSLARILFKKNLYDQCNKVLKKAEKEADKREMFLQLLDILKWQLNVIKKKGFTSQGVKESERILRKNKKTLQLLNNLQEYQSLHYKMGTYSSTRGKPGNKEQLSACKKLAETPLLKNKKNAISQTAMYYYNITNAVYARLTGNNKKAFDLDQENVKLFQSSPDLINIHPDAYITSLNNCIVSSILLKKFPLAENYISTLNNSNHVKEILKHSEFSKNNLFLYSTVHELDIYIHTGRFNEGDQLIKNSKKSIEKYNREINSPNIFFLYYNAACIYFGMGEYKEALKWLNKIEINNLKGLMLHVYSYERLLSLIIHYELGNYQLVTYKWKSVMNFLQSKNYKHKAAYHTIKTLKNLSEKQMMLSKKEVKTIFKNLYSTLKELKKDKHQLQAFDYFDYLTWTQSKFEDKSFEELTVEKSKSTITTL